MNATEAIPPDLPTLLANALGAIEREDKEATDAILVDAEQAIGDWNEARRTIRYASCAVDIGQWDTAKRYLVDLLPPIEH